MPVTDDPITTTAPRDAAHDEQRDGLAERLFGATLGAFDLLAIHLGSRLGLYGALADGDGRTADELAAAAGIAPRYALEWLEHQAVGGVLEVDGAERPAAQRRYRLPSGHAEVLTDPRSLATMIPMADFIVAAAGRMSELADAYRSGGGVPWDGYGPVLLEAQAAANRPIFEQLLPTEWIAALPDVADRLGQPDARIADVATGAGWSAIAMAQAWPHARVDGIDRDAWSVERATANARAAGVDDRVSFIQADAAQPALAGRYDLVTVLEAVHDLARPVEVLRSVREMVAPGGAVLVVDEAVAERFAAPGDDLERLMYGYSILVCLPNAMGEPDTAATGTVMRPSTLERYAREAGFSRVEVLPVEHEIFRLYRLDP